MFSDPGDLKKRGLRRWFFCIEKIWHRRLWFFHHFCGKWDLASQKFCIDPAEDFLTGILWKNGCSHPKFQWKYASFTIYFLYVRHRYTPDPEFSIFLGLGTNFVCHRYKKHLEMLCFTAKPLIFSPGRYFFLYMPKTFWTATTVPEFFAVGMIIPGIAWGSCQGWRTA